MLEANIAQLGDPELAVRLSGHLRLPVIVAPMFLVSGRDLVIASCKAGVIGSLPSLNARTTDIFDGWLTEIEAALGDAPSAAPHAVNLIVHRTNMRLEPDLDVCVAHKVPLIIAAVGSPRSVVERVHSYGGLVFCDAASVSHARRAAEAGVDGLILLSAGAGGNTGWLNPFAFVGEVRRFFQGPVILAGAISRGRYLHAAQVAGADMAVVGTNFIAAAESEAADEYRGMLVDSIADDIVLTAEVTGIPANMLRASLERSGFVAGKKPEKFDLGHELETMRAWRDIWSAGHGVGAIERSATVAEIVEELRLDYAASTARIPA